MHRKSIYSLVFAVAILMVLGIVMLFSTSAFAQDSHGDPFYFIKRQSMWLGFGVLACAAASMLDYHFWERTWKIWFGLAAVFLILCYVPHIGLKINGARRWVGIGPIFLNIENSRRGLAR